MLKKGTGLQAAAKKKKMKIYNHIYIYLKQKILVVCCHLTSEQTFDSDVISEYISKLFFVFVQPYNLKKIKKKYLKKVVDGQI